MPLPRFSRLPPDRQQQILEVAGRHLARDGCEAASYNRIIADAGISKTSAYMYFDGKDDLVAEVVRRAVRRSVEALGPWPHAGTEAEFWVRLRDGAGRLQAFLADNPGDLAVLRDAYHGHPTEGRSGGGGVEATDDWFDAVLDNGTALGAIRGDIERPLLRHATIALFRAVDSWVLDHAGEGDGGLDAGLRLVRSLWTEQGEAR